jgi:hypothetical protein
VTEDGWDSFPTVGQSLCLSRCPRNSHQLAAAATTVAPTTASWPTYNGDNYLLVRQRKTFADAEATCVTLGAHLASVHSTVSVAISTPNEPLACLSARLSASLPACLPVCPPVCLSVRLSACMPALMWSSAAALLHCVVIETDGAF